MFFVWKKAAILLASVEVRHAGLLTITTDLSLSKVYNIPSIMQLLRPHLKQALQSSDVLMSEA